MLEMTWKNKNKTSVGSLRDRSVKGQNAHIEDKVEGVEQSTRKEII